MPPQKRLKSDTKRQISYKWDTIYAITATNSYK